MSVTITARLSTDVARLHNLRDIRVVSREPHIDLTRRHEVWHDEAPEEAYERLFGEAVRAYNEKQKRADRKISSYYREVCEDKRRRPVYEMIIGVYGEECDEVTGHQIMGEFVKDWEKRNPNLELIGAYYHADEEGRPHVHIDFVPVATGYVRGAEKQCCLDRALQGMGFQSQSLKQTAQIAWEFRENNALERLCNQHGLEVVHPQRNQGAKHLKTDVYKLRCQLTELMSQLTQMEKQLEQKTADCESKRLEWESVALEVKTKKQQVTVLDDKIKTKKQQVTVLDDKTEMAEMALRSMQAQVNMFLKRAADMDADLRKVELAEQKANAQRYHEDYGIDAFELD